MTDTIIKSELDWTDQEALSFINAGFRVINVNYSGKTFRAWRRLDKLSSIVQVLIGCPGQMRDNVFVLSLQFFSPDSAGVVHEDKRMELGFKDLDELLDCLVHLYSAKYMIHKLRYYTSKALFCKTFTNATRTVK